MVEGHSVHRVATRHRQRLVGKSFTATSPNGRFTAGAEAIDGKVFHRCEAVGKNLFAFFKHASETEENAVVVHVHFGMAGNWAVYDHNDRDEVIPEPTSTNRLRLVYTDIDAASKNQAPSITADLSAMTVKHGTIDLYAEKKAKLGQDPLREDADPNILWNKVCASKKSIGALIMDQSYFTGPGNIYRAEILFKAGIHPDRPGQDLERHEFDRIWTHTVALLQRGYETGSILTVDPDEARQLGKPTLRRYIYNASNCPRCQTRIQVWTIASRTCYACPTCQPRQKSDTATSITNAANAAVTPSPPAAASKKKKHKTEHYHVPFNSHCAREPVETRLLESGPQRLTVNEIKVELARLGVSSIPKSAKKAVFVKMLQDRLKSVSTLAAAAAATPSSDTAVAAVTPTPNRNKTSTRRETTATNSTPSRMLVSSEDAAAEKATANESLAVEHIAELAPGQARRARARAAAQINVVVTNKKDGEDEPTASKRKRSAYSTEGSGSTSKSMTATQKKRRQPTRKRK